MSSKKFDIAQLDKSQLAMVDLLMNKMGNMIDEKLSKQEKRSKEGH